MAKRRSGQQRDDFGRFIRPGASYQPLERGPGGRFRRAGDGGQGDDGGGDRGGQQGGGGRVERLDYGAGKAPARRGRRAAQQGDAGDGQGTGTAPPPARRQRRPAATSGDPPAPARRTRRPAATSGDGGGQPPRPPRMREAFGAGLFGRPFWQRGE